MDAQAALKRATLAYRAGRYDEGLQLARLAEQGEAAEALTLSALCLAKLGRGDEAIERLERAALTAGLTPRLCDQLCELELNRERIIAARRWLERSPPEKLERPARRALNARINDAYRRLPSIANELARAQSEPGEVGVRYELARMLHATGAPGDAWQLVQPLPPSKQAVQALELASLAGDAGDLISAAAGFQHVLRLNSSGTTLEAVSRGLFGIGHIEQAIELAERAVRAGVGNDWQARLQLYSGKVDVARRLAEDCGAHDVLAAVALVEERFADVLSHLEQQRTPTQETAVIRGETLRRLGAPDDARRALNVATALGRKDIPALHLNYLLITDEENPRNHEIWRLVAPVVGAPAEPFPADPRPAAEAALRAFSGNRTAQASYLDADGRLHRHFAAHTLRHRVVTLQGLLSSFPLDEVLERFDALLLEVGSDPLIFTYRAELQFWWGRYEAGAADCQRACALDRRTRWARLGVAASELFLGRPREALRELDSFTQEFFVLPNPLVYRGEALYQLRELDAAEQVLREAVLAHPTRVAAWVLLAALGAQQGKRALVQEALAALEQRAAPFLRDVLREAPFSSSEDLPSIHDSMQHALSMLRGNRSSGFVTYFTRDGRAHRARDAAPREA